MNSFEGPDVPKSEEGQEEREKAFSPEGVLNRNFGKSVERPSEAQFYRGGILNRQRYQENLRKQREEKLKALKKEIGETPKEQGGEDPEGVEQPFSKEGLLNRNFGKDPEKRSDALFYRGGILNRLRFWKRDKKQI